MEEIPEIFSSPEIAAEMPEFIKLGRLPLKRISDFNRDVKTLEKLCKSYGLQYCEVTVYEIHTEDEDYIETLYWNPQLARIMYHYKVVDDSEDEVRKPLLECSYDVRRDATGRKWLLQFFRKAKVRLEEENEFYEKYIKAKED